MAEMVERKTYSELIEFATYSERLKYLWLGDNEMHSPRDISNPFYHSKDWQDVRSLVISRDLGSDMGLITEPIRDRILVHHMNPITRQDLEDLNVDVLLDPNNLITVSYSTHNKIHYGKQTPEPFIERVPGDTKLW